jgi:hypothetical protein
MGLSSAIGMYNSALRPGWYMDWDASLNPLHPDGAELARTIRLHIHDTGTICGVRAAPAWQRSQVIPSITGTALIENLYANPGALWLIGNEPDSIYNGAPIMPELYAELYHEFYTFIKTHDPSAQVAIGAIVQPSPLRLEYLDKVLNRYQTLYGEKLPTALWNIHMYTLREVPCDYGGGTPPGTTQNGWLYDWWQWSDINLLKQHLPEMRQWMAARGERDKPLIITEFGVLVPDDGTYCGPGGCITQETSRDYLQQTFSYFLTTTNPNTGFPADSNRIVQAWAWYSLYDYRYGGDLVYPDPPTYTLTLAGQAFAQLTSQHRTAYADLYPIPLITPSLPSSGTDPVTVSLTVQLDNRGNRSVQPVPVRFTHYDYATGQLLSTTDLTVSQVLTRYAGLQPQVSHVWTLTATATYTLAFEIDPEHTVDQARRSAQQLSFVLATAPDLAIVSLIGDAHVVDYQGTPITQTITATVRNVGVMPSFPANVEWSASIPNQGTGYWGTLSPVPALAPSASAVVTSTLAISSPGVHVVTATLQYGHVELDTRNNAATLSILAASHHIYLPLTLRAGL